MFCFGRVLSYKWGWGGGVYMPFSHGDDQFLSCKLCLVSIGLHLNGHKLNIVKAVSRGKAEQLEKERTNIKKEPADKRNLYLAREGVIRPESDAAKDLSKGDLMKRQKAEAEKRTKLANPNNFVSDTR